MHRRELLHALLIAPLVPMTRHAAGQDAAKELPKPTADALLERIRKVYAGAKTYRDTGLVTITFFKPDGAVMMVSKRPFATAFVRPDRFRYEYTEARPGEPRPSRFLIVRDADRTVRTWWDVQPGIQTGKNLGLALAGATGVSGGSASNVPTLLLAGEASFGDWTRRKGVELLEDAETAGRRCHRLKDTIPAIPDTPAKGSVFTYWVDAETLLLRRIEQASTFPDFFTEQITTYEPVLDGEVPDAALAFDPPAKAK